MKFSSCILFGFFLFLISSCEDQDHNFCVFPTSDVSFQIYPGTNSILRVVRGEGVSFLQVFDTDGKFRADQNLDLTYPFTITKFNKDSVQISYLITKDDLKYFLPWFEAHKNISGSIAGFEWNYAYIMDNGTLETFDKNLDSLSIVRKDKSVDFFEKGKLVDRQPIASLFVNIDSFDHFDYKGKVLIEYHLKDTTLVTKFLKEIPLVYKQKK